MTSTQAAPRRRKPWIIAVPLGLFLLFAAVWCGLWFYAAHRAEAEIEAWLKREARVGRTWGCAERSLAGFPFRFELVCRAPSLETQGGDPLKITAARAHAVAQVWAPNHIVAEFASPARVEDLASGAVYDASWSLLQMSGVGDTSGRPQRMSIVIEKPKLDLVLAAGAAPSPGFSATHLEVHARRTPATGAGRDGVDFAAGVRGAESATLSAAGAPGPLDMKVQGNVSAADDMRPMPLRDRLRAWAEAGGAFRLDTFEVTTPKAALSASGNLSVDPQGRLNGAVNLGFAGVEEILKNLSRSGVIAPEIAPIVGALALAGKTGDVAGRKGSTFAITFRQGVLQLGKFPVGIVPPLF